MSELSLGQIKGLPVNSNVVTVPSGHTLYAPGHVLQVVSTTKTDAFSASLAAGAFTDITGLSATITPKSSSSQILIIVHVVAGNDAGQIQANFAYDIQRGSTSIAVGDANSSNVRATAGNHIFSGNGSQMSSTSSTHLDSPNTTSETTYKVRIGNSIGTSSAATMYVNRASTTNTSNIYPRVTSSITLMEIAA